MQESVPPPLLLSDAGRATFLANEEGCPDPLSSHLLHELLRCNALTASMRDSLATLQVRRRAAVACATPHPSAGSPLALQRAVAGLAEMTGELEQVYTALRVNAVPAAWAADVACVHRAAIPPLPAPHTRHVCQARALAATGHLGRRPRVARAVPAALAASWRAARVPPLRLLLPAGAAPLASRVLAPPWPLRLMRRATSSLQGFLTAVLQRHARDTFVSVRDLTLRSRVTSFRTLERAVEADLEALHSVASPTHARMQRPAAKWHAAPEWSDGEGEVDTAVLVSGLWLEGAHWDEARRVIDDPVAGVLHEPLPPIRLTPSHYRADDGDGSFLCPLYRTSARGCAPGHYITAVQLPMARDRRAFVLRGVAVVVSVR